MNGMSPGSAIVLGPSRRVRQLVVMLLAAAMVATLLPMVTAHAAEVPPTANDYLEPGATDQIHIDQTDVKAVKIKEHLLDSGVTCLGDNPNDIVPMPFTWRFEAGSSRLSPIDNPTTWGFSIKPKSSAPPCADAHYGAVVYNPVKWPDAFTGADKWWPQALGQRKGFTIPAKSTSTTTVTFDKQCRPQQFDVITSSSPSGSPSPIGDGGAHAPLVYATFDLNAAWMWSGKQYDGLNDGNVCVEDTPPPSTIAPT